MGEDSRRASLDAFRARLPLAEIVGRQVRLQKRGRELIGLCPFHDEKTPSFHVVADKGFYHCFGCGAHGNAIDFVMAHEGLAFADAIERLATITGIPAPRLGGDRDGRERDRDRDKGLLAANEAAMRWFQGRLAAAEGETARAYLERRGIDAATSQRFQLGFAPAGRDGLKRALIAEGFGEEVLVEAGLVIRPEDGGAGYDRFRERITFPIHDRQGRVVAFGARALGDAKPKYLNSPETPLFHKREALYGQTLARRPAREAGALVVAEGYMDVIALAQAGIAHAVAPLGTAISEEQLRAMWQLADEPVICLDGDEAGLRAAGRLALRALPELGAGKSLRFALLSEGDDPDSLLRREGAESLTRRLGEAVPLVDFLWWDATVGREFGAPERQAALRARLRELAGMIADRELAGLYREAFEARFRARFRPPRREAAGRGAPSAPPPRAGGSGGGRLASALAGLEKRPAAGLIAWVLADPALLEEVEETLALVDLPDPGLDALRQEVLTWYSSTDRLDATTLGTHLTVNGLGALAGRLGGDRALAVPVAAVSDRRLRVAAWRRVAERYLIGLARRQERAAVIDALADPAESEIRAQMVRIDSLINGSGTIGEDADTPTDDALGRDRAAFEHYIRQVARAHACMPDDEPADDRDGS